MRIDNTSPVRQQRWLEASAAANIPSFGAVEITGTTMLETSTRAVLNVKQPTGASLSLVAINGILPITSGFYGEVTMDGPMWAQYDNASTPAIGETWGTQATSYKLKKDNDGFLVIGAGVSWNGIDVFRVMPAIPAMGFKKLVRFTLSGTLTTSNASQSATITNQYGTGTNNTTAAGGITVHNLLTHSAGVYVFSGDSGDAGLAYHDSGANYRILQMECP